jgi:hypothetical protein
MPQKTVKLGQQFRGQTLRVDDVDREARLYLFFRYASKFLFLPAGPRFASSTRARSRFVRFVAKKNPATRREPLSIVRASAPACVFRARPESLIDSSRRSAQFATPALVYSARRRP